MADLIVLRLAAHGIFHTAPPPKTLFEGVARFSKLVRVLSDIFHDAGIAGSASTYTNFLYPAAMHLRVQILEKLENDEIPVDLGRQLFDLSTQAVEAMSKIVNCYLNRTSPVLYIVPLAIAGILLKSALGDVEKAAKNFKKAQEPEIDIVDLYYNVTHSDF